MENYLMETPSIDYKNSSIQKKVHELRDKSENQNKETINVSFSLDDEHLVYTIRSEFGEIDYHDNHADLDERLVNILMESENISEITIDFEF